MEEREGSWRTVAGVVLVAVAAGGAWWSSRSGLLSLENLRDNADVLRAAVERSYLRSALLYVLAYMTTALVLPGALVLTVAGGFLFGVIPAALLINIGGTLGALAGFAAARSLAGHALQERYSRQLSSFNAELELHGVSYLLMLRIVPLFPFFVVNVLAGLTRLRALQFTVATSLGILPGSLVFAYAGRRLRDIHRMEDLLTPRMTALFVVLGLVALAPVLYRRLRGRG